MGGTGAAQQGTVLNDSSSVANGAHSVTGVAGMVGSALSRAGSLLPEASTVASGLRGAAGLAADLGTKTDGLGVVAGGAGLLGQLQDGSFGNNKQTYTNALTMASGVPMPYGINKVAGGAAFALEHSDSIVAGVAAAGQNAAEYGQQAAQNPTMMTTLGGGS